MLVGAVVVHRPDFFLSSPAADEVNLAFGDARDSATQAEDDLVCKLVGNYADRIRGRVVVVLFAQDLRRSGGAFDVVEPALNSHFIGGDAQVAEGQHGG